MGNGIEWDLSREKSFFSCAFFVDVTNETSWILVGLVGLDSTNQNGDLMGSSGI